MGAVIGPLATGIVVALVAWYFITRLSQFTWQALVGVLGAIFGGVVATFLGSIAGSANPTDALAWYAGGLLLGTVAFWVARRFGWI